MRAITPSLWFDGRAEEAAAFYTSLFPDSRTEEITRAAADNPSTKAGEVLLVTFTLAGQPFVGVNGGPQFPFTEAVSFVIDCDDQAEVDRYWAALVEGGGEHGQCGWLKDRFGLSWQVVPREMGAYLAGPDAAGAARAMQAMLRMQKLDLATLRAAYEGVPVSGWPSGTNEHLGDATQADVSRGFEAIKTVTIHAPRATVWDALTNPAKVKQYLHGTDLSTDWQAGSPIRWQGEWQGQSYVDKGTVLAVEPPRLLRYTHWSSMGGSEDTPEHYHTVTYELAEEGGTTRLTLTQDNNATQAEADTMAERNWGPVLEGLKATVEQ